jgi:hypothetical protein
MQSVAFAIQHSVHRVGDVPPNLTHPQAIRSRGHACDLYLARR